MAVELSSYHCECGNSIEIRSYHHAGGVNDTTQVTLECDNCHRRHIEMIENVENALFSGASIVN